MKRLYTHTKLRNRDREQGSQLIEEKLYIKTPLWCATSRKFETLNELLKALKLKITHTLEVFLRRQNSAVCSTIL
jgi:hypothetical protein